MTQAKAVAVDHVTGVDGRLFAVRIVRQGDAYGRDGCLTHDEAQPLVEFYDAHRANDWPDTFSGNLGQFVSRYYWTDLADHSPDFDLDLDGGVPEWTVTADSLTHCLSNLAPLIGDPKQWEA